jgi:hypothetical protein
MFAGLGFMGGWLAAAAQTQQQQQQQQQLCVVLPNRCLSDEVTRRERTITADAAHCAVEALVGTTITLALPDYGAWFFFLGCAEF